MSKLLGLLCSLALTAVALVVAYQVRPQYDIPLGTTTDAVLLRGFDGAERPEDGSAAYRWSTGEASITLQDIGQQDFDVAVQFNGWRPPGQPPPSLSVTVAGRTLLKVDPPPQIIEYSFRVPRELVTNGTLALHLTVNPFSLPDDPRELGIWTQRVRVSPTPSSDLVVVAPPLGPFLGVLGAVALLGLGLMLLGWGAGSVFVGSGLVGALATWLVVADRLWLTTGQWYLLWPQAIFAGLLFALLVGWLGGLGLRLGGANWSALQRRVLLTVMLAAFVVRLAGQLHPQIHVVDLDYHVHRLELVESGQMLFTSFAVQSGSRYSFYLPTAYVFILPFKWLLDDEGLSVMLFTIGISTLGALLVFYIAKRVLADGRAGVLAGALYLIMPMSVIPFSWGITTNIFAEFFALVVLALLVGTYSSLRPRQPAFWLFAAALFVALLGHSAVVQLVAVAFVVTLVLWWTSKRIKGGRKEAAWGVGAFAIAALMAFAVYYRNWIGDILGMVRDIGSHNAAQAASGGLHVKVSGAVDDRTLGLVPTFATSRTQWLLGGLRGFWNEAQAYYRVWPIAGGALGWLLIWPTRFQGAGGAGGRVRLALTLLGWTLSAVLFALVGLALNLYVRYMLFALPVVALCGGLLLSALWRRSRAGVIVSVLLVAYFAVEALALWQYRIDYLYK
jgi:hypothetical protein